MEAPQDTCFTRVIRNVQVRGKPASFRSLVVAPLCRSERTAGEAVTELGSLTPRGPMKDHWGEWSQSLGTYSEKLLC